MRLWKVFSYELKRNLRRKGYLFATFGIPVLVFVLGSILPLLFGNGGGQERTQNPFNANIPSEFLRAVQHAGYIDETGLFSNPGELRGLFTRYDDEAAADAALAAGDIDTYYLIPADYLESGDVTQVMSRLSINMVNSDAIEQLLRSSLAQDVDPQIYQRLSNGTNLREIDVGRNTSVSSDEAFDTRFIFVYVFGLILLGSLFMTNGYLLQSVIEEKESRLIEILISTVRPFDLLTGKILAFGILGLLQVSIWTGTFVFLGWLSGREALQSFLPVLQTLANLTIPYNLLPLLLLYFILGYAFFAGLYGIVGAISNSMREGPQYAIVFTLPAVLPFYFISIFATTPNDPLPLVLSLFPLTAPLGMAMRLVVTDVPFWQVALSLGLLAISVLGSLWLASRMFRVNTLLAGRLPRLRDLPRLVRG
ncbi:MAG: ABC transporter permease [Anaerolineae bacterium]|nr:ABC transporter permease [Anaerolineae bacterium]